MSADLADAVTVAAKAFHNDVFNADQGGYSACSCASADEHDEKWHADVVDARRALEAAAPVIRRDALPACPECGCTLPGDPDASECGCDAGCNDGPHAPGINALIAAERERIRQLAIDLDATVAVAPTGDHPDRPLAMEERQFADMIGNPS